MIGAIVMVFVLIWVYQTGTRASVNNTVVWVMVCAGVYLATQIVLISGIAYFVEALRAGQGDDTYEQYLENIGDTKNKGSLLRSPTGSFMSVFFELMPPIVGFLLVALVRTKFMLKEALTAANLFSGFGDMFRSIKESFKNPEQQ
jgi:hypothetical protein